MKCYYCLKEITEKSLEFMDRKFCCNKCVADWVIDIEVENEPRHTEEYLEN